MEIYAAISGSIWYGDRISESLTGQCAYEIGVNKNDYHIKRKVAKITYNPSDGIFVYSKKQQLTSTHYVKENGIFHTKTLLTNCF